ncbi:Fis family transcriptional regulator [Desulfocarbo indianensis]|nr:Fis family transcriptional regulator [Desulfocarbo indianensis]
MDFADYWKAVADTMQDGLLVVDDQGTILQVNPAVLEMTGYEEGELVGQSCRVLNCTGCNIYGQGRGRQWCSLFVEGKVLAKQCFITGKNGEPISVTKRASVLKDDQGRELGAVETLYDTSELLRKDQEINALRRTLDGREGFHGMLGNSPPMQNLYRLLENVAPSTAPVLIWGESGSGKELAAKAIHELGPRSGKPFIKVNCAALNENLLESELFGHVKGAFTGAERARMGRFEAASGGDLLLDEVGDIPLATQVKLLRVIEQKEIERVGDHRPIAVDVRIMAATNRNLEEMISEGRFREDLFYRINVVPVMVPSLRQRREDIPLLIHNFVASVASKSGKPISGVALPAMDVLMAYSWPGNVRELLNAVEYAVVLCPGGDIGVEHLPPRLTSAGEARSLSPARETGRALGRAERQRRELVEALEACGGNQSEAARRLGVSRVTVWNRCKRFKVDARSMS